MTIAHRISWNRLLLFSAFLTSFLIASVTSLSAQVPDPNAEAMQTRNPMETEGLEPKLARILKNYYRRTFTNQENWEKLQSVTFEGVLHLSQGQVPFTAHKKKPDLYKVVLRNPQGERIVMGYDGEKAWQLNFGSSDRRPMPMPEAEAKNFIRDAPISGHLLDPLAPGKKIELLGIVDIDGRNCFELKVSLPDGQRIRSAIDILEYAERQQITINNVNGQEERYRYGDFRVIAGVRFPFASAMESGGELVHRVEMKEIRVNAGLIKPMFQPASELHSLRAEPREAAPETGFETLRTLPEVPPFGGSRFGESLFPEPQADEGPSNLDPILKRTER